MRLINADNLRAKMGNLAGFDVLGRCIDEEPTVCDIDAIRAEIEQLQIYPCRTDAQSIRNVAFEQALEIIDRHLKGANK